jgi:hypothetical protein
MRDGRDSFLFGIAVRRLPWGTFVVKRLKKSKDFGAARREPRLSQLLEIRMSYEGSGENVPLRPPDISVHGMFVNTSTHFPEGAIVNLRFRLPRSNVEVQTRGEVRYCLSGIGVGVEFVGIRPEALRAIEREIRASYRTRTRKN